MRLSFLFSGFFLLLATALYSQEFTRQDSLRGSITPERAWWNVLRYDLAFAPDFESQTLQGVQRITFEVLSPGSTLQVDLQAPMAITDASISGQSLPFVRDGNVWFLEFSDAPEAGDTVQVQISFEGKPRVAVSPPWDGGWIWKKDKKGRPWMSVACQGLGASVWFPCKDHQSDKPDLGASMSVTVPDTLVAVANGRLVDYSEIGNGLHAYAWEVTNPINTYNMVPYIGAYVNWNDRFEGVEGTLDLDFWVLDYHKEVAQPHFAQVHRMLSCFEEWLGPYPFYFDGYKLVEAPHLGMEHQSGIAYGNRFFNGYLGSDISGTGWGLKWDFIIVHESGHEWYGNSITAADIADMWVHEGFTSYTEVLFVECNYGVQAGQDYVQGARRSIQNDKPLIGPYGVNKRGSGDMYQKGSSLIHTIRHLADDDSLFRAMLLSMNETFYKQVVTSAEVEAFIIEFTGLPLAKVFDQYLRHTAVPVLEYWLEGDTLHHRWREVIEGFDMPLRLKDGVTWIRPTQEWQQSTLSLPIPAEGIFDANFFVNYRYAGNGIRE